MKACHVHISKLKQPKILEGFPKNKIFNMPFGHPLNQPQVRPASLRSLKESASSASSRTSRLGDKYSASASGIEYISNIEEDDEDDDDNVLRDIFVTTFKKIKNRNRFTQKVFLLLGVLMCFSFITFFFVVYLPNIGNDFRNNWLVLFIIFVCLASFITMTMFLCTRWLRRSLNSAIVLIFLTAAVTLQFTALGVHFEFVDVLMFSHGALALVFFLGSILASLHKCEATGMGMVLFFTIMATVVSVGVVALLTLIIVKDPRWEVMGGAVLLTLVDTIVTFVVFLLKDILQKQELKATDYTYGALILYASMMTFYAVKAFMLCLRRSKQEMDNFSTEVTSTVATPTEETLSRQQS